MNDSKEYHGFHESYYEHRCPIKPEKDVLNTDIIGTGYTTKLKRWWKDLFLLSLTNEQSKCFFISSHAMRMDRFRQYRKYKSRIHPMSKFTKFWNALILVAFVLDKILLRFTSTVVFNDVPIFCYFFGVFLEVIIVLDLFIITKTGYIDRTEKRVVLNTKRSLIYYGSKKLFLYTISAIPIHWFMFLRFGEDVACGLCKSNIFMCVLRSISTVGLYRIFELSSYWTWHHIYPKWRFLRIAVVGLMTMVQFYELVDVTWIITILRNDKVDDKSFMGKLVLMKYGESPELSDYMFICYDISRILKSLLLFSFGVRHYSSALDKMSSMIAYAIAIGFYIWCVLECFMIMGRNRYPKDQVLSARCSARSLLITRQLSDTLKYKVDRYFEFQPTRLLILEHGNDQYNSLPEFLKREITLSCHSKRIMRLPMFSEWPLPMIEEIVLMLKQEVYLDNDVVADALVESRGLMIVDIGILAVYSSNHEEIGHLIDGDYFDEISLVTDNEVRTSYLLAATPCRMLILDKNVFRHFMKRHRQLFYELKDKLLLKYEKISTEMVVQDTKSLGIQYPMFLNSVLV